MTSDLRARLHDAINAAVSRKRGTFTGADIANDVMRLNPTLWDEARDVLALEKLVAIATGSMRGPLHQANSAQLDLPGFEDVPKFIRAGSKWIAIGDANAQELADFATWYRKRAERIHERSRRDRQILSDIERLTRLVGRYDKTRPGITVSEVLALREVKAQYPSRIREELA